MAKFDFETGLNRIQTPVISFDHVSKRFSKGTEALRDISFKINKGEFVFIVGDSGSGKSTLLKLLLKETLPTEGKIYVAGREIGRLKRRRVAEFRRSIGVVFQDFRLLKDRTAYENVAFAQRMTGVEEEIIARQVPRALSLVGLHNVEDMLPKELSGGEQQRVAVARALVNNPMILLADEPTGNLDPKNSWELMQLLEDINKRGTTVVVVTHNQEIVDRMKKRVITLQNGEILHDEEKSGYSKENRVHFDIDPDLEYLKDIIINEKA